MSCAKGKNAASKKLSNLRKGKKPGKQAAALEQARRSGAKGYGMAMPKKSMMM